MASLKEIHDPVAFLRALRQSYWRGQSYQEMYDQLSQLLLAKLQAERDGCCLTPESADELIKRAYTGYALIPPHGLTIYTDNRLAQAIDTINQWEVGSSPYLWHVMHRAWLRHHVKRDQGQYYTPEFIKRFMVSAFPPMPGQTICDPCGGSAGLLLEVANHLADPADVSFYYFDIDGGQTLRSASMAMATYVHPSGHALTAHIEARDSLAGPWPCQMDRVYTNVPFGVRISRCSNVPGGGPLLDLYETGRGKASELSQVLFIEQCLRHLTNTGALATVVDKGVVTNRRSRVDRIKLLRLAKERGIGLKLVVQLPGVAFEYVAGTIFPTYLLFFAAGSTDRTSFGTIINPGYGATGYVIDGKQLDGFPIDIEGAAWAGSDWSCLLSNFRAGALPSAPYADMLAGDWHHGAHAYREHNGTRLRDLAVLVEVDWPGRNNRDPTVDRSYRIVVDTHLKPLRKNRSLQAGCLLMSRLISPSSPPCTALVPEAYDGAGCTNENYIIKTSRVGDAVRLWYLINFDIETRTYLLANARGQGRGRILAAELLDMPVADISPAKIKRIARLLARLLAKGVTDRQVLDDLGMIKALAEAP